MDPLAFFWVQTATVERHVGEGAYGPIREEPATVPCWIEEGHRLVRAGDGREVVSDARVFLPIDQPRVPVGSRVTLPAEHGDRVEDVVAVARHHHPAPGMPSHWELALA